MGVIKKGEKRRTSHRIGDKFRYSFQNVGVKRGVEKDLYEARGQELWNGKFKTVHEASDARFRSKYIYAELSDNYTRLDKDLWRETLTVG